MALVFQYGSNTSPAEMNGQNRLRGDASPLGLVCTKDRYEFAFDVWSEGRKCFASDIRKSAKGRTIWGVLYKVPDDLMSRATVPHGRNRWTPSRVKVRTIGVRSSLSDGATVSRCGRR